jgi:hypothetical protein
MGSQAFRRNSRFSSMDMGDGQVKEINGIEDFFG